MLKHFFIDEMEDTLFVANNINDTEFEEKNGQQFTNIINYRININKQINKMIDEKVESLIRNGNYSRYELYNDFTYSDITNFLYKKDKYYNDKYDYYSYFKLDLDKNVITADKVIYNPYTNKVENFERLFSEGVFKDEIETRLQIKEYERGIMPKYIYELMNIYNFIQDKQTVNIKLKDCEKYKVEATLDNIVDKNQANVLRQVGEKLGHGLLISPIYIVIRDHHHGALAHHRHSVHQFPKPLKGKLPGR